MRLSKMRYVFVMAAIALAVIYLASCGKKDPVSSDETIPAGTIVYGSKDSNDGDYGLYSMDAAGGNQKQILDTEDSEQTPDCSSDGNKIAFLWTISGKSQIYTMDMDGANLQKHTSYDYTVSYPRWSPGDSMIAYQRYTDGTNYDICVINLISGSFTQLTADTANDMTPSWSPDGSRIIFTSNRDGDCDIYAMDIGLGTDPVNLTMNNVDDVHAQYSHDGEWIVYVSPDRAVAESDNEIFKMRADGSDVTQLTNNSVSDYTPCWSPDDSWIAYRSYVSGPSWHDIFRMRADGSNKINITNSSAIDAWPDWTR